MKKCDTKVWYMLVSFFVVGGLWVPFYLVTKCSSPTVSVNKDVIETSRVFYEGPTATSAAIAGKDRDYETLIGPLVDELYERSAQSFGMKNEMDKLYKRGKLSNDLRKSIANAALSSSTSARWSCNNTQDDEKLLLGHPSMHAHLSGEEYFKHTWTMISQIGLKRLENTVFLEVGYGIAFNNVVLRGLNTEVYATEAYPVPWVPTRHGPFFDDVLVGARAAAAAGTLGNNFSISKAAAYARHCGRDVDGVHVLQTTLEKLEGIPDRAVRVSYSRAVLEHIWDVQASMKALARVSQIGAISCHVIDLRDHRDFNRPWDFLLMSDESFMHAIKIRSKAKGHPQFGNRLRLSEFIKAAAASGFETVFLERRTLGAGAKMMSYGQDTIKQLRACEHCKYRDWPLDDLNGCTDNGMPMTSVFWCSRYLGKPTTPVQPTCGLRTWKSPGFDMHS